MCFVRSLGRSRHPGGIAILGFCALVSNAIPLSAATTIDLVPIHDNTLYEDPTGSLSNGLGDHCFAGMTGNATKRRAVFLFDLSGIPSGSIVQSANLKLTMDRAAAFSGARPMTLHNVQASWGEGASRFNDPFSGGGQGVPAQTNDATWLHRFFSSTLWSQAGGDFDAAVLATTNVADVAGVYQWSSTPGMVASVQAWLNTPSTNFGWILVGDEATTPSARRFWTREAAADANRPHLIITYDKLSATGPSAATALRFEVPSPNPFNPSTTFRWDAPVAGKARITVWDVRGSLVATPLEASRPAGPQAFAWQARDARGTSLPSGVYVVQLEQAGETRSQRVVLVR
jgi:hypothetical protein